MKSAIILILLSVCALAQGPLTPPPLADPAVGPVNALDGGGAPQATMKTLHQVEPRTAIPGGTSVVVIDQSGSYYLTSDITVADGRGVEITTSNVTLDLNGFSIISTNDSPDTSDCGVGLQIYIKNVTIRNGVICGGGAAGKFHSGIGSIGFTSHTNVSVADVTISDTTHWGIVLDPSNSKVERCLVKTDGVTGAISAGLVADCSVIGGNVSAGIVRDTSVTGGRITGNVVKGSFATGGITASVADNPGTAIPPGPAVPIAGPHFTISQPGSYYLTGNIEVASGNGINITASNVTLDLRGFSLISTTTSPASGNAIDLAADVSGIAIKNGQIKGGNVRTQGVNPWNATFTNAGWHTGIKDVSHITPAIGVLVSHLVINQCRKGIHLQGPSSCFDHVTTTSNAEDGIYANGSITNSNSSQNGGSGIFGYVSITNSTASQNGQSGIKALDRSTITNCATFANALRGIHTNQSTVTDSTANSNGEDGFLLVNCVANGCTATFNRDWGIWAEESSINHCLAKDNNTNAGIGGGIYGTDSVIAFCYSKGNTGSQYDTGSGATVSTNR